MLLLGIALLVLVDVLHECGLHLRAWVIAAPRPVRWAVYEFAIFAFLLMAAFIPIRAFCMLGSEKQQPRAVPIKGAAWGCFCLCGKYKKRTKL